MTTYSPAELTERQRQLLVHLVRRHIVLAEPVSSQALVGVGSLACSSATLRNDLAVLEAAGYVEQPYTSAGRVPTELAYEFYVRELGTEGKLSRSAEAQLTAARRQVDGLGAGERLKAMARQSVELAQLAAYVAPSPYDYYYTGLGTLLAQPEFAEVELACSLGEVLDHLDRALAQLWSPRFDLGGNDVTVVVGSQNPFGIPFASVLGRTADGYLFGLLGPQRMDYERSLGLVRFIVSNA